MDKMNYVINCCISMSNAVVVRNLVKNYLDARSVFTYSEIPGEKKETSV